MPYIYPCSTTHVSDSFADHVNRASPNPGTDYTAGHGSKVFAVANGVVTDVTTTVSGGGGRMVHIDYDDGSGGDYLHLSAIQVTRNQRVFQGHHIADSGASGLGSEWGYDPHLHYSHRTRHGSAYQNAGNVDFDAIRGDELGIEGEDEMALTQETKDWFIAEFRKLTTTNLYRNKVTEEIAVADVSKGYWRVFRSMPDMATLQSLGIFYPDEQLQEVDYDTYNGIRSECQAAASQFVQFALEGMGGHDAGTHRAAQPA